MLYRLFLIGLIGGLFTLVEAAEAAPAHREFPPGQLRSLQELPSGRFRDQLERLPQPARERALAWLNSFHFTTLDTEHLHADSSGGIYYADTFELEPVEAAASETAPALALGPVPVSPFPPSLLLHSRPGAPNVIYLDFDGENVTGTQWNTDLGRTTIPATAFSMDSDFTTFSDSEQTAILRIWQRVAEDYAPFNVDVTTERPATMTTRTAHALITRNTDSNGAANPSDSAGGVAYVNVFASSSFTRLRPAWIYANNLSGNEAYIAEAVSHEIGHNFGLSHDGTSSKSYYGGHGSGETSWGPLMGTAYGRNVSQWSKGEYYMANNTEDDVAIIGGKASYIGDDHSGAFATATALVTTRGTNILSTTPETDPGRTNTANKGVIGRNTDVDVFSFSTGSGQVNLRVNPWVCPSGTRGGNLDVSVELYNQQGILILSNNSPVSTGALIQTNLAQGVYFLQVRNSDAGAPLSSSPSGYTSYGSVGQYFISGTVSQQDVFLPPPPINLSVSAQPAGMGSVTPGSGTYDWGSVVQLTALPSAYYKFVQWSGGLTGTSNPVSLTLTSNVSVSAQFAELVTTNYSVPHWWLAARGITSGFEAAVLTIGANGIPLWQSYVAGLEPTNAASRLVLSIRRSGSSNVLNWTTANGRVYTLLSSPSPATGFAPVPGALNLPSSISGFTNNTQQSRAVFYRLEVKKP